MSSSMYQAPAGDPQSLKFCAQLTSILILLNIYATILRQRTYYMLQA